MSLLLKRATENEGGAEWRELPDGVYRWIVGKPEIVKSEMYGNLNVKFPLTLTEPEKKRVIDEVGEAPEGTFQSWRPAFGSYRVGLSLGYIQRDGTHKTTKLVDFLCCLFGSKQASKVREWIASGGGPVLDPDDDEQAQIRALESWLEWFEGLEVLGSIKGEQGKQGDRLARFGGPLPVGSSGTLWGADPEYQVSGLGKFRAMVAQMNAGGAESSAVEKAVAAGAAVAEQYDSGNPFFNEKGEPIAEATDDEEAELERKLAEAKAKKAGKQPVAAGSIDAKYDALFPAQGG